MSLVLLSATGVAQSPEASFTGPQGKTMSAYRNQATAAIDAVHNGNCETATQLGKSLEREWDTDGPRLIKQMPLAYTEIDGLMDGFIGLLPKGCGEGKDEPHNGKTVDQAYEKYVAALARAEVPSYGTTLGGDSEVPIRTTSSGLTYVITRHGDGPSPRPGEIVVLRMRGLLANGDEFYRTKEPDDPLGVEFQEGRMVRGLFEGIGLMHRGDSAMFVIPSALGYGIHSGLAGAIPPNATVICFIDILDIKAKTAAAMLRAAIEEKGVDYAVSQFHEEEKQGFPNTYIREADLNDLGYKLLAKGDRDAAIAIFKLNTEAFPKSANVYDSLAEGYAKTGNRPLAIDNYKRALALDPHKDSSIKALKELQDDLNH
jgi:FKBP-type peptidyl-prolyl cis-trans isomerase